MGNLATNLATNPATDLAYDMAGEGAWWKTYPAHVGTFRYGAGESLVGGALDQWATDDGAYTLAAPSAPQRFTDAGTGWTMTSANLTGMTGSPALASQFSAAAPYTWYYVGSITTTNQVALAASKVSTASDYNMLWKIGGTGLTVHRRAATSTVDVSSALAQDASVHVLAIRYDGTLMSTAVDGAIVGGPTTSGGINATGLDRFSIGFLNRPVPFGYASGEVRFVGLYGAAHSDADIAAVSAQLASDWGP